MSSTTVYFRGGPLNGQRKQFTTLYPKYIVKTHVPRPMPMELFDEDTPFEGPWWNPFPFTYDQHTYVLDGGDYHHTGYVRWKGNSVVST